MSSAEIQLVTDDYTELVAPRLDAYGITASGVVADAISNSYHYYVMTRKLERPDLLAEQSGELVLDEEQTVDVLQALHWICNQRSELAKQSYGEAHNHMKAVRLWNHSKKLAEIDQAITVGNQFSALSEQQRVVMMAVGIALIESTRMRLAIES